MILQITLQSPASRGFFIFVSRDCPEVLCWLEFSTDGFKKGFLKKHELNNIVVS